MASLNNESEKRMGEFPLAIVAGILLIAIVMGSTIGRLYDDIFLGILLVLSGLFILVMVVLPQIITNIFLAIYIGFFIAAYDFVGYNPLLIKPVKIFYADGILIFFIVFIIATILHRVSYSDLRSPITFLLIINLIYGFAAIIIGFSAGNSTNNILGDFRRFFLYPLVALLPLLIRINWSNLNRIFKWLCLSLSIISIIAFIRVISNTSWDPEQFSATNQFRATGYFSGILLCIGVGILYAVFLNLGKQKKIIPILILGVFETAIFASGYRMLWVLGVFLPFFITYISARGIRRVLRILGISIVVLIFILVLTFLIRTISPDIYDRMATRFLLTIRDLDFTKNIRFYAWTSAWSMFINSPIIGVGIGDQFEFLSRSSSGLYYISHLTTHNILMSLLYQTGIIGAGIFIAIHGSFTLYILKSISTFKPASRILMFGMLAGYFSALIMGMVQPSFESPGAIVIFYFFLGFILNINRMFASGTNE